MSKEHSLLFHSFCFLVTQLNTSTDVAERLRELHQQIKSAAWDKDGVAWSRFLRAKGHLLSWGGAETLLSLALAEPEASPVAQAAEAYLQGGLHKRPLLRSVRRPTIPVPTAVRRTLAGHTGMITKIELTPHGLLSASLDKTMRLWSLETGEELRSFAMLEGINKFSLFADKGRVLALGGHDIFWWSITSGQLLDSFSTVGSYDEALALHPDEGSFFESDGSGRIYRRSLSSGEVMRRYDGHSHRLAELLCLPGGRLLSASIDGELRFWQMETGECLHTLDSDQRILSVVTNAEKTRALSGDKFGTILYWDLVQPKKIAKIAELGTSSGALSFAFSPDNTRAISGSYDGVLRLWDLRSAQELQSFYSISADQNSIAWYQESQALVANRNHTIHQIDLSLPSPADPERHQDHVVSVSKQESGPYALSGAFDGTLLLWDIPAGRLVRRLIDRGAMPIQTTAIHPSLPLGASTHWNGVIDLWDLAARERVRQLRCPQRVTFLAFACDDARIISRCEDGIIRAYSREGALLWSAEKIDQHAAIELLPDDKLMSLRNGAAVILNLRDGTRLRELSLGNTCRFMLHPDQASVLTIGDKLTRWRLSDAAPLVTLPLKEQYSSFDRPLGLGAGVVLPDGETLAHSGQLGEISLWSLQSGEKLRHWSAHPYAEVYGLALFPKDRLISIGEDRRLIIWELSTQKTIASWQLETDCCSLAVTPTGRIVCGDSMGGVLMLDLVGD